ncbi:CoA transferase OS=Lysinibacillus sphaericus OX=1421 GN=LS41612_16275 PE=3 SV=1 [Lysinibacillus sphaericus]
MICVGTDGQFQKFCTMLERQEWATDARFITNTMRKQHEVELVQLISDITITKTRDEWIALLQQYKIPGGRVNSIAEALEQPQVMARDMIGEIEHKKYGKIKFVKNPLQFSNLNIQYKLAPPILGEHTNEFQKSSLPK